VVLRGRRGYLGFALPPITTHVALRGRRGYLGVSLPPITTHVVLRGGIGFALTLSQKNGKS